MKTLKRKENTDFTKGYLYIDEKEDLTAFLDVELTPEQEKSLQLAKEQFHRDLAEGKYDL